MALFPLLICRSNALLTGLVGKVPLRRATALIFAAIQKIRGRATDRVPEMPDVTAGLLKEKGKMGKVIGIDLGTTNSCVAVMEGKEPKELMMANNHIQKIHHPDKD